MVTFSIINIVCSFSPGTNTEVSYGSKERERGDSRNPIKGKQKNTGSPGKSPPSPGPVPSSRVRGHEADRPGDVLSLNSDSDVNSSVLSSSNFSLLTCEMEIRILLLTESLQGLVSSRFQQFSGVYSVCASCTARGQASLASLRSF